jgi:hypothetical protein
MRDCDGGRDGVIGPDSASIQSADEATALA